MRRLRLIEPAVSFPLSYDCASTTWVVLSLSESTGSVRNIVLEMLIEIPERYPFIATEGSAVLRGLVVSKAYRSTDRPPLFPVIYEFNGPHPSHRVKFRGSRTFVYLIDSTPRGKALADAIWSTQTVPGGSVRGIRGLLEMEPGDALLARPIDRDGSPEHDCLQALSGVVLERELTPRMAELLSGSKYSHEELVRRFDAYEAARDALLGHRSVRASNDGKAIFELDPRAQPIKDAPRCYPFNSMVQRPRQVEGPAACLKTVDNEYDEHQINIRRYSLAATALNTLAWDLQGPPRLINATRAYTDHINTPRVGHYDNCYWPSMQNNVSNAQHPSEEQKFAEHLGSFSGVHKDKGDAVNGVSAGLVGSDLPDYAEPGRFHLVGQGVYFRLTYMAQIFFTGLLPHGGTTPLIPEDIALEGWETRMFTISYPPSGMLNGEARHPFASLPYELFPLYIPPELTGAFHVIRDKQFWSNHVTYAQEGGVSGIQLLYWVLRQTPLSYGVEIDCNTFTSAVTYLRDGERVPVDQWEFAPNPAVHNPFGDDHKRIQDAFLQTEYNHLMQGIPSVVDNKFRDWNVMDINFGGRPKARRSLKRPIPTTIVGNNSCSDDAENTSADSDNISLLHKRSRLDTVAANCLRSAMENEFPMVVRPSNFPIHHQANTDVDISEFCTVGPVEASATSSSSSLAPVCMLL
ncbi:hypothetical protein BC629DRAFT_1600858 [Irpex lacteus]|nr:hypothetical protein BC629DRAFT_1600858 [Irpex lacteus]